MRNLLADAESATLDFDSWHKSLDPEYAHSISYQLSLDPDAEASKRKIASTMWLSAQTGLRVSDVNANYESVKAKWAADQELPVDQWKDEATFQSTVRTHADDFRAQRLLAQDLAKNARRAALWNPSLPFEAMPTMQAWRAAKAKDPGFKDDKVGRYEVSFAEQVHRERDKLAPVLPLVDTLWGILAPKDPTKEPVAKDIARISETVSNLSKDQQDLVIGALQDRAEMLPDKDRDHFVKRWAKNIDRSMDQLIGAGFRTVGRAGSMVGEGVEAGLNLAGISGEEVTKFGDQARRVKRAANIMSRLSALRGQEIDPIVGDDLLERIGLGVASSVPGVMAAYAVSPLALYSLMEDQAHQEMDKNLRNAGVDDKRADDIASSLSPVRR